MHIYTWFSTVIYHLHSFKCRMVARHSRKSMTSYRSFSFFSILKEENMNLVDHISYTEMDCCCYGWKFQNIKDRKVNNNQNWSPLLAYFKVIGVINPNHLSFLLGHFPTLWQRILPQMFVFQ